MSVTGHVLPGAAEGAVAEAVERAAAENVFDRARAKDPTLWGPEGTPELANRLGWIDIAGRTEADIAEAETLLAELQAEGYTDVVVLGMGGSSLAPEVFRRSFANPGGLTLHVLDTTEPLEIAAVQDKLPIETTLFIVSSKSGGTVEPNSLFAHFYALTEDGKHFVAVTDPGTHMGDVASEHGFRKVFVNDPDIGGRYSALSWFGIVPAALAGIDVKAVLETAVAAERASEPDSGLWLGAALGGLANTGHDKLAFIIDPPLEALGLWAEQLIAESTGKQGKGMLPIADEPIGDNYGSDRVFLHVRSAGAPDGGNADAVKRLADAGHPIITMDARGPEDLGRIFYELEFATAVLGWALGINPFDQPNVQEAKDNTNKVLAEGAGDIADGELNELTDGLAALAGVVGGPYIAIMGYLPYEDGVDAAVAKLRAAVIARYGVATTFGYGPRFLHSTGQYHKGGPKQGRFLQFVHDSDADEDIPGADFDFRKLVSAQADGDLQTLRSHGLTAVRVRLSAGDLAGSIDRITATIQGD
ncbi:MAG: transaldolase / glucose-6-phosphate isomerase [Solirubrobacteraceae bacterium]|jgi:glucose-6-phosphate isomerase|nr:transaldolase / glucose-6-phosphate isomerase [Solirubrobacteraceae bacterium]